MDEQNLTELMISRLKQFYPSKVDTDKKWFRFSEIMKTGETNPKKIVKASSEDVFTIISATPDGKQTLITHKNVMCMVAWKIAMKSQKSGVTAYAHIEFSNFYERLCHYNLLANYGKYGLKSYKGHCTDFMEDCFDDLIALNPDVFFAYPDFYYSLYHKIKDGYLDKRKNDPTHSEYDSQRYFFGFKGKFGKNCRIFLVSGLISDNIIDVMTKTFGGFVLNLHGIPGATYGGFNKMPFTPDGMAGGPFMEWKLTNVQFYQKTGLVLDDKELVGELCVRGNNVIDKFQGIDESGW